MPEEIIGVEELIAAFTSHLIERYPSVEEFQGKLDELIRKKGEKFSGKDYVEALERNLVYLNDLVTGVEALIDGILKEPLNRDALENVDDTLSELERMVQSKTEVRYGEVFSGAADSSMAALLAIRENDRDEYLDRIEFEYRYLFTLKLFLLEFVSVLSAVGKSYSLPADAFESRDMIFQSVDFLVHYYLGNVRMKE